MAMHFEPKVKFTSRHRHRLYAKGVYLAHTYTQTASLFFRLLVRLLFEPVFVYVGVCALYLLILIAY